MATQVASVNSKDQIVHTSCTAAGSTIPPSLSRRPPRALNGVRTRRSTEARYFDATEQ